MIPFNKPYLSGKETQYIEEAVLSEKISGNGLFTQKCHEFFEKRYGFQKVLLTTSCTAALEMAALLIDIQPGDEVIIPSFTFVSTANAFILRGAKVVFADSSEENPNIDVEKIESLITPKTRAIVPVHYSGIACDMDVIMKIAKKHDLLVVEDSAHVIDSFYKGKPLGSIGHFAAFSFHETKNIIAGEGGMLVINDGKFNRRAEIIWEKGTNRAEFFRGEVNKYGWVDIGSSFLPSEIIAAFLMAQLESLDRIQIRRKEIWNLYNNGFNELENQGKLKLPVIPEYATNNAHLFYLTCSSLDERTKLIEYLKEKDIQAVFHYLSLHKSLFYKDKHDGRELPNADFYSDCLVRLPLFYELTNEQAEYVIKKIIEFYH
jgi:dTDP-4-amino-4,6-dideoxygalactose transaminase